MEAVAEGGRKEMSPYVSTRSSLGVESGRADGRRRPNLSRETKFSAARILEEQRRLDEKRRVKRAANRKSASTSRARKKAYVDEMTTKNERMKQHALILSMLPDLVLAVCRSGEMTYVSPSSQWLLLHSPDEVLGANIFELVTNDCHPVLRKMISDNLSRPVHSQQTSERKSNGFNDSAEEAPGSDNEGTRREKFNPRGQLDEHRERFKVAKHSADMARDGLRGGGARVQSPRPPQPQGPKMLRLIRCDKTTVWCESRLSVRTTTNGGSTNPTPLEIILTLRPELEGSKTSTAHGISRSNVRTFGRLPSSSTQDADAFVDDDDGYQCEVDEEDSTNSGSGNDSSAAPTSTKKGRGDGNGASIIGGDDSGVKRQADVRSGVVAACVSVEDGEGPSFTKKRKRVSMSRVERMSSVVYESANKSGGEESSTGAESGDFTTQEGGASSCSNEADSNGEGSNNSCSKWGDGPGGESRCGEFGGSEDGSTDGSSASGTDLGDEEQSAAQSLILMGGQFGEGS